MSYLWKQEWVREKNDKDAYSPQVWVNLSILLADYECIGTLIEFWALTTIPDDLQLYNPLADQPPWHPHSIPDSLGQALSNDPQGQANFDITHRTCWARIHHQSNHSEITGHSKSAVDDYELPVVPTFILFDTNLRGVLLSKRTWHYL